MVICMYIQDTHMYVSICVCTHDTCMCLDACLCTHMMHVCVCVCVYTYTLSHLRGMYTSHKDPQAAAPSGTR